MRKRNVHIMLSFILWATSLLSVSVGVSASTAAALKDISASYAKEEIRSLYQAGIVLGDADGYYRPKKAVTRAEFVAMLTRTWKLKTVSSQFPAYSDVPKSSWAYGAVQAAVSLGIVNGTTPTAFSPNRTISRQEAAALLIRAMGMQPSQPASLPLSDAYSVAYWARPYVAEAIRQKLLVGYQGYFRPNAPLSREETAVLLSRVKKKIDQQAKGKTPVILGWQYRSTVQEFIDLVKDTPVNTLSPRWFYLQADSSIADHTDATLVRWAHQNGRKVWAMFGNRFDANATHNALSVPANRAAVVNKLAQLSDKYQIDGINIDFENIKPGDREAFTAFVKELAQAMHAKGRTVSVDVPPDTQTDWSAPYDYANLARYADYIVLMGYEEHWSGGPSAGSVSSLPWLVKSSNNLLTQIPADKYIVGLPLYTRDWSKVNGAWQSTDLLILESYRLISQNKPAINWNPATSQYKATYWKNGTAHSIWLEESRSLGLKMQASMERPIAGFAYWYVGEKLPDVWNVISNVITMQKLKNRK
ncbi:S-layer homology domain-containing protein [Brevibacillus borstelensis]|uniref:S-layer homology domain-containing protein n=1 Tax=Brevibacillus TaxID=55080 RepID=UPI001561CA96|nr:S-layer homology domain-containing protein [Brevibacillus borstelensis]MBE5394909.1 S-layer homology domain-containing protein [Brevibacillus borstelensis]